MYADHIFFIEPSWAATEVVRGFDIIYCTTYPRWKWKGLGGTGMVC